MAVLCHHCAQAFSSFVEWGPLSSCRAWASHCGGLSCCRAWALGCMGFSSYCAQASVAAALRLNSTHSVAVVHMPHGTWDPPRTRLKPMSPALAGRLPTTGPPGKPFFLYIL